MFVRKVKGNVKKGCEVEIGEKTIIVGPNGSGKSTIVNTVELALTGRAGDIAGRTDIAREADVMSLAHNGAPALSATVEFDNGEVAAYHTEGSTAKAKKAVAQRSAAASHDEVLPIRTLREAVLGSPTTARKYLMGKVSTATHKDIEALIPSALSNRFVECFPANVPVADGLVAAIEYAGKRQRECNSTAKTAREAGKIVSGGRGAPPTDADIKAASAALKDARTKQTAVEDALNADEALKDAEAKLQKAENEANDTAVKLTAARTALNAAKPPKGFAPVVHLIPQVIDESCVAGECLCCGGKAPSKLAADEIRAALKDYETSKAAHDKLASEVAALEGLAKATLQILDRHEAEVATFKKLVGGATDTDLANAELAVNEAEKALLDLKASRDAWLKVQQAESTALDAERQAVEWKALKEAMEAAMAQTIEHSLSAFVSKVQSHLPKGDTFEMKLRDGDREVVSFGLVRDGHLHTALSGAEWARVTAAMASACVPAGAYACVIPEERAFDPSTLKDVLVALSDCPQQVILTSPVKPKSVPKGWTLVERE